MSARNDYPQLVGVDDALCNALDEIDRLRAENDGLRQQLILLSPTEASRLKAVLDRLQPVVDAAVRYEEAFESRTVDAGGWMQRVWEAQEALRVEVRRQQEAPAPDICTCGHSRSKHPCAARGSECPCRLFWPRPYAPLTSTPS